jgi:transposase
LRHAGSDATAGVETGAMTPWLVHGLRTAGIQVECLDARRVKAALQMRPNKTDQNDAEGLAQVVRDRLVQAGHVKSLDAHRARSLLGAWAQLVGMSSSHGARSSSPRFFNAGVSTHRLCRIAPQPGKLIWRVNVKRAILINVARRIAICCSLCRRSAARRVNKHVRCR